MWWPSIFRGQCNDDWVWESDEGSSGQIFQSLIKGDIVSDQALIWASHTSAQYCNLCTVFCCMCARLGVSLILMIVQLDGTDVCVHHLPNLQGHSTVLSMQWDLCPLFPETVVTLKLSLFLSLSLSVFLCVFFECDGVRQPRVCRKG